MTKKQPERVQVLARLELQTVRRLDKLCRDTQRARRDMIAYLINKEHEARREST